MWKLVKRMWTKWCDYFELIDLESRNSKYMSRKWNIESPLCPMCKFKLEYDDVIIDSKYVRSVVGCPSCGWTPDEVVK